ncbi:uncharacterized protein ACB058_006090 [Synchiropus picturatus]
MAAVGLEVTESMLLSPGVAFFIIILFIVSVFLTALCSDCTKRSFELQEPELEKNASDLVRVVKLEEVARENPMINEMQNDEKEFKSDEEKSTSNVSWRLHSSEGENQAQPNEVLSNGSMTDVTTASDQDDTTVDSSQDEDTAVSFTAWRSHLRASKLYKRGASINSPYDSIYKKHTAMAANLRISEETTPAEFSETAMPTSTLPALQVEKDPPLSDES